MKLAFNVLAIQFKQTAAYNMAESMSPTELQRMNNYIIELEGTLSENANIYAERISKLEQKSQHFEDTWRVVVAEKNAQQSNEKHHAVQEDEKKEQFEEVKQKNRKEEIPRPTKKKSRINKSPQ